MSDDNSLSDIIEAVIESDGGEIKSTWPILSVDILREVNRIPFAKIKLYAGDLNLGDFDTIDSKVFKTGAKITISGKVGQAKKVVKIFEGLVVKKGLRVDQDKQIITLDIKDPAFMLTRKRASNVYEKKKDSEIIKDIIGKCSSVKAGTIKDTDGQQTSIVRYYCTDWDFIVSRADINGHWVLVKDGTIDTVLPEIKTPKKPVLDRTEESFYFLEMELDGREQYKEVESYFWDIAEQKLSDPAKASAVNFDMGDAKADDLAKALGGDKCSLMHAANISKDEAKSWAQAKMIKSRIAMLKGSIQVEGQKFCEMYPGDTIEIKDMGKSFSGKTIITGIRHQMGPGMWTASIQFGLTSKWFYQNEDIIDAPAAGLLPGVTGLQIGVVDKFKEDSEGHLRARVKVPGINSKDNIVWARQALLEAGKERGFFFRPETGDEVVLGFINDDPRQAVILGGLYNKKNTIPKDFEINKDNNFKGLTTREGSTVLFDDKDKQIEIRTKNKNLIRLSDKDKGISLIDENKNSIVTDDKGITVKDKNGNKIILDKSGITIKSGKDFKIEASGKGEIKGSPSVKINASEIEQ